MDKDEARAKSLSPVAGLTKDEFEARAHEHLRAEELEELRAAVLARLPVTELDDAQLATVYKKLIAFSRWEAAERALEESLSRAKEAKARDALRVQLVYGALDARVVELGLRIGAQIEAPAELEDRSLALELELLRGGEDRLDRVERELEASLRTDPEAAINLAHTLLLGHPALGVFVARGAFDVARPADTERLLHGIDRARDDLRLTPFDPFWDVYDLVIGKRASTRAQRRANQLAEEEQASLRSQVESLRERLRDYSTKASSLEKELERRSGELEDARKTADRASKAAVAGREAKQAEERAKDLKRKVEALKAQIAEGNEERRRLRGELADLADAKDDGEVGEPIAEEEPAEEEEVDFTTLALLTPVFTDAARADLDRLPRRVAADAVRTAGELGAGDPPAWRHAKRLQGLGEVYSARLGIHHRMLFRKRDGNLEVFTIVDREDLDKTIAHLR